MIPRKLFLSAVTAVVVGMALEGGGVRAASAPTSSHSWQPTSISAHGGAITAAVATTDGDYLVGIGAFLERMAAVDGRLVSVRRSVELPGSVYSLANVDDLVVATIGHFGLMLFDPEGANDIPIVAELRTGEQASSIVVRGSVAYLAEANGLRAVDVSDPLRPVDMGIVTPLLISGQPARARVVMLAEPFLVGSADSGPNGMIFTLDLVDPTAPALVSSVRVPAIVPGFAVGAGFVAASHGLGLSTFKLAPSGELEPLEFEFGRNHRNAALALFDGNLLRVDSALLTEYDLAVDPPAKIAEATLSNNASDLVYGAGEFLAFTGWGAGLYPRRLADIQGPVADLQVTGPIDALGWSAGCGIAKSWLGNWRFDPGRPEAPFVAANAGPRLDAVTLAGWNGFVIAAAGTTRLLTCVGEDAIASALDIGSVPDGDLYFGAVGAAGDDDRLFVVEVASGIRQRSDARLTVVRLTRGPTPSIVGSTPLPMVRDTAAHVAAAGGRAVVAWEGPVAIVAIDESGAPSVTAELSLPHPVNAVAMTSSDAFVSFGAGVRRYGLSATGQVVTEETIVAPGTVVDLEAERDRVVAIVRRDSVGERGHKGAVYQLVTTDDGVTELVWITDFPLESGLPKAELHWPRMSITAGLAGTVWLEQHLGNRVYLPALSIGLLAGPHQEGE
jgi:hypothetical protein